MIELRVAETDDELELWRSVRRSLLPNERAPSIAELRAGGNFLLLAYRDGELAGSGSASNGDISGAAIFPRVLPGHRRLGVGTALLHRLACHAEEHGHAEAGSQVEDEGSLAFARRFGFAESGRQVEQVRAVGAAEPWPEALDGVEVISADEHRGLIGRLYDELALQAFEDMPTPGQIEITRELWESEWVTWPEATFAAVAGGEIVGMAGLVRDDDRPDRAENVLTTVRRDRRGEGVARLLKEHVIAWASRRGIREIYTWTQTGNENMRAVNEWLGYGTRNVVISVRRALPL
ncbi:MAG TPA: GNAT family N-acetyltransferase [Gaiellaceae bacterium]|nr:GNAT family N-acetyltransferase [Gaiellaceae bacterium]